VTAGGHPAHRRLRFVILVWAVVPGGTLSVLRDWVPRLAERGDVSIVTLGPDRASLGVPTITLGGRRSHPYRFPNALGYVARMAIAAVRSTRGGRATVLMPQDTLATGAAAVIAALVSGARVAVMEHGSAAAVETDRFWRERTGTSPLSAMRARLMRLMLRVMHRLVLRRMDVALLAGDDEVASFRASGVGNHRLMRYRFGIDLDRFHPPSGAERAEARRRWGVDQGSRVILSVGRLAPEKGVEDLVAAVAGLPADLDPRLVVAGDGPLRADLERATATAGVTATFVGGLEAEDVAVILHAADCFVYPALRGANTPFAVLEAMASGLPVVATTAPAVHGAMLADGRGVAIEPGDRDAMRAGIIRFLRDPQGAAAAGAAARRYVATHHTPGRVDEAVDALLERLAVSPPRGGGRRPSARG
jgi:glycosyltransferase involved in cell wall biosynthesis